MEKTKKVTLEDVMAAKNKSCGENTITTGRNIIYNPARIPFGVFALDYAIGGGVSIWGSTCLWGPRGGGKSTLVIKFIKMCSLICWSCFNLTDFCTCSQKSLKMKPAVGDIEGTLDVDWMEANGVTRDDYYIVLGNSAEEYFDLLESCLQADDCCAAIGDSLGAATPEAEMQKSFIDSNMGKHASLVTKIVRKLKQRLIIEKKRLHPCTVIYTNQMRSDLQKQFGSKESMAGGHAAEHEFSLLLRCVNKVLTDAEKKKFIDENREVQTASRHAVTVRKSKIFTMAGASEFLLVKEDIPEIGLKKGDIDDYKLVIKYARDYDLIKTINSGYTLQGTVQDSEIKFSNLTELINYFAENKIQYFKLQSDIINKAKNNLLGIK